LTGFVALDAGEMMDLKTGERTMIWTPAAFVGARREPRHIQLERLRSCVDQVVSAHARHAGTGFAELSGGLDSAIVAGSLQATSAGKVVQWANFYTSDPEGDERRFARAVASHLGLPLVEVAKSEFELTEACLTFVGKGLRPSHLGIDYEQDEETVRRCAELGANTLFTGLGGDAVFLQTQTPLIAADAFRAGLTGHALFRVFRDLAAMRRDSIWAVARGGIVGAFSHARLRRTPPYLSRALIDQVRDAPTHPWLAGLAKASPAKQLQIRALTAALIFHGHSRRGLAVDLIHPLLSQPLLELVLSVPTFDLALGSNDRALAREAFADRLPPEIMQRRSKGDLLAYYGRMVSRSLGLIRPYLLDGLLARQGVVDRPFLEDALTPENLLWRNLAVSLVELLAVEVWARRWHGAVRP
jgi:asparagine synthase (glutamine-hydrolysing)